MIFKPKGEKIWVTYLDRHGKWCYIMTTKEGDRGFYYLYNIIDGKLKKVGKAKSPLELEIKFKVMEDR